MRRISTLAATVVAALMAIVTAAPVAQAADWRSGRKEVVLGITAGEDAASVEAKAAPFTAQLGKMLGLPVRAVVKVEYADIVELLLTKQIDVAGLGAAGYARAWIKSGAKVRPVLGLLDDAGEFGYRSVLFVRADSPAKAIKDLKGKTLALVDPDSTSGNTAPRFFMKEAGFPIETLFASTSFAGSYEKTVRAVLDGKADAGFTFWTNDAYSSFTELVKQDASYKNKWKIIWRSPLLPDENWTVRSDQNSDMVKAVASALLRLPKDAPKIWSGYLGEGASTGYREVSHDDYAAVVRMVQAQQKP